MENNFFKNTTADYSREKTETVKAMEESELDDTLYTEVANNIGQMRVDDADEEVARMIRQTGKNWHKDFHKFMYCIDETDPDVYNPCTLNEGYCWVTCD